MSDSRLPKVCCPHGRGSDLDPEPLQLASDAPIGACRASLPPPLRLVSSPTPRPAVRHLFVTPASNANRRGPGRLRNLRRRAVRACRLGWRGLTPRWPRSLRLGSASVANIGLAREDFKPCGRELTASCEKKLRHPRTRSLAQQASGDLPRRRLRNLLSTNSIARMRLRGASCGCSRKPAIRSRSYSVGRGCDPAVTHDQPVFRR